MTELTRCPFCEGEIGATVMKCRHCGEWIRRRCERCGTPLRNEWAARGICAACAASAEALTVAAPQVMTLQQTKSRGAAIALAFFLGGIGAHKFYLGRPGWGLVYFLLCWTFLPSLAGVIESIGYVLSSDEEFREKYG